MSTIATFSPDSKAILTASKDGTVQLWESATGKPLGLALQHPDRVWDAVFSLDGKTIVTGSGDRGRVGKAWLWDAATGRRIGPPLSQPGEIVFVLAVSSDSKAFLTSSLNRETLSRGYSLRLWRRPIPVAGDAERIMLWTQVDTDMELDETGIIRVLDTGTWHKRRQRLEELGGPPLP